MNTSDQSSQPDENQDPKSCEIPNLKTIKDAVVSGCSDGAAVAKSKAPEVKDAFVKASHDIAYGISYGTTFAGALFGDFLPQIIRDGLAKGAADAKAAAEKASRRAEEGKGSGFETPIEEKGADFVSA